MTNSIYHLFEYHLNVKDHYFQPCINSQINLLLLLIARSNFKRYRSVACRCILTLGFALYVAMNYHLIAMWITSALCHLFFISTKSGRNDINHSPINPNHLEISSQLNLDLSTNSLIIQHTLA